MSKKKDNKKHDVSYFKDKMLTATKGRCNALH